MNRELAHETVAADDALLVLQDVSVALRHGRREMISWVELSVRRRELFGIVGESGSGNTLFARTVFGLHDDAPVTGGRVTFDGCQVPSERHHAGMKKLFGRRGRVRSAGSVLVPQPLDAGRSADHRGDLPGEWPVGLLPVPWTRR